MHQHLDQPGYQNKEQRSSDDHKQRERDYDVILFPGCHYSAIPLNSKYLFAVILNYHIFNLNTS